MYKKKNNQETKTNWHRLFSLMFGTIFETLGFETIAEYDVSRKSQLVDVVVVRRQTLSKTKDLPSTYYEGFEDLNDHNLLSFKSFHEVFNEEALEEFYGHYSNYKKVTGMTRDKINLYVVTYHYPEKLFTKFNDSNLLCCVKKNKIFDLKILKKVRFIITKGSIHPVLGLFSNDIKQIKDSMDELIQDKWLIYQVSAYVDKLYEH